MTHTNPTGTNVLVTGAGTGIGHAIALEFGRNKARLALHYSHDHQLGSIKQLVDQIAGFGGTAETFQANFLSAKDVTFFMEKCLRSLGRLDVVINNAGITLNQPLNNVTAEQIDTLFAVNVRAPLLITKRVAPVMRHNGGGVIINLASVHAHASVAGHSVYAATKGAIVAMTRQLAIELAPDRIRVNAIAPGWIETEYQHSVAEFDAADIGHKIPAGRIGQPEDVAKLAVWLTSENASYITGQTITIDGGMTSWLPVNEDWKNRSDAPFGRGYIPGM